MGALSSLYRALTADLAAVREKDSLPVPYAADIVQM